MALTAAAQSTPKHTAEPWQRTAANEAMGQDFDQVRFSVGGFTMSHLTRNFAAVFRQAFEARQMELSAKI